MSLGIEWFAGSADRNKVRDTDGVSPTEAEATLLMYRSSVHPVATELAEWLCDNWTIRNFLQLQPSTRALLLEIIDKEQIVESESPGVTIGNRCK